MNLTLPAKKELIRVLGPHRVLTDDLSLSLYAYDCSLSRTRPEGVLLIENTNQISPVLQILSKYNVPFVPRASATNHAGSCVALKGGVILNLTELNRILEINTQEGFAVVEPGVLTGDLQLALEQKGYFYAPDPASTRTCTLGGNFSQNASGARCLKYGPTSQHILAARFVLPDGKELSLSCKEGQSHLLGLLAGSEGTLGIFTQLTVKILPLAKHIQTFLVTFPSLQQCVEAVSDLTAQGIIPRCVEAMDQTTARTIESFAQAGYPTDAAALLLLELDGKPSQIKKESALLSQICKTHLAQKFITAHTEEERQNLWQGRRQAFAAMARLAPSVMVGDGTVARSALPQTLARVQQVLQENQVQAGLLFHAGDGNFHPHLLFDEKNRLQTLHTTRTLHQISKICVDNGGTLSGEHGIGVEKRSLMAYEYEADTLSAMAKIKQVLDPQNLSNPLKILPQHFTEKSRPAGALSEEILALQKRLLAWKKENLSFLIAGKNTRLKAKQTTFLSSATLDKILEIDTSNYTATVQSGVELSTLVATLKKAGVYSLLPNGEGTIGGLFCAGVLPEFYAHVTGVEALLLDGSYVRYGGKLMKNAAGYPLTYLLAGSKGEIGLVTQLTFKVFAVPQKTPRLRAFKKAAPCEISTRLVRTFSGGEHGKI